MELINKKYLGIAAFLFLFVGFIAAGCSDDENPVADYDPPGEMADLNIEAGSFSPRLTWSGGYVSVIGVNRGPNAALDSSLVWLIHTNGNNIRYPIAFGEVPSGAEDLTAQYGGTRIDSLNEDNTYTFWMMKEELWNQVSSMGNKYIKFDSTITSSSYTVNGDTINVGSSSQIQLTKDLDVFINISGISTFGRLGVISIEETNSNSPLISWTITQEGITDSLISAIGITEGGQYDLNSIVWEVYSVREEGGETLYGKDNIIAPPVIAGQQFENTQVFAEFPEGGLQRGKTYYVWIAAKDWDGASRLRFAESYAYATFNVN